MRKILLFLFIFFSLAFPAFAQTSPVQQPTQNFFKGKVITVQSNQTWQQVSAIIEDGNLKGKKINIEYGKQASLTKSQFVSVGQEVVISENIVPGGKTFFAIYDLYRIPALLIFLAIFFIGILLVAGIKGIGSVSGMAISLGIILLFIVPSILKGMDPLTVTLIGSALILLITTYLAHGVSNKTTIAVVSTLLSLVATAVLSIIAIKFASITGLGNEDAFTLQIGPTSIINLQGLFLSGIIIGTLGALNDITTTQSATIAAFKKARPDLDFYDLFSHGMSVGREHIASLVNTLILAYVGSSFAVMIFVVLNPAKVPYWVILNNELLSDEIIKTIAGSIGLLLSVPIVTGLAAWFFAKKKS